MIKRWYRAVIIGAVLVLAAAAGVAVARPPAQDIIVPLGPRGDIQQLYRSFDGGAYEAQVVSLAPFDDESGAALMIDSVHHEVHEGKMWHAAYTNGNVANTAVVDLLFHTGVGVDAHSAWEVFASGAVTVSLYESPVISNTGVVLTAYNMNRAMTTTAASLVYSSPTITSTGTVALVNGRILPGGSSPTTRVGGGIRSGAEWILKPNTYYLMRVTNTSGAAAVINVVMEWYEETH